MADPEDLKIFESGETDLQRCDLTGVTIADRTLSDLDLRNSKLKNTKFLRCKLRNCNFQNAELTHADFTGSTFDGCHFGNVIFGVNFTHATFSGGSISGIITRTKLVSAGFRGVKISRLTFQDGNDLTGFQADSKTNFDHVQMERALSRLPVFQGYRFERGMLVRGEAAEPSNDNAARQHTEEDQRSRTDLGLVKEALRAQLPTARILCTSISALIDEYKENAPIPNEPAKLDAYISMLSILERIQAILDELTAAIADLGSKPSGETLEISAKKVLSLRETLDTWWNESGREIAGAGVNIGLIGAGTAFLTLCGAPALGATAISGILLGAKPVKDMVIGWTQKD